ncbi:SDR family oxidoreductase [Aquibacillus koreensis]|uniref:SDR family oxidoreductase n=1 Tax=Aquibacillus koreensis TaxID=279446 RepID=A0A9X3WLA2_9BACI|nr:SDR family oxidoreductase [Aquibacillus koreensis]MCT2534483.1 SDR family oxidoreductase [Aquibacillus koreensis]MDC3421790.1 SDR family oxidoreductase [Aquibacillus koreensis]
MSEGHVAIITGANSGMGKATSIELAKTGATVVMVCRDQSRGDEARKEVQAKSGSNHVHLMLCDLGSLQSIRDFCAQFKQRFQRLDMLVNNAGVVLPGRHETKDGFELQFGVNHLGHFLLTNLLLDLLRASAPSRIVNVSSGAHKIGKIYFDDVNLTNNYRVWRAYGQSKLANILFTYELADRLHGTGVTVNCLHPGAVATHMGVNRETGFGTLITRLLKPFFQTAEEGAQTAIYLATSPDVRDVTGKYFYRKKPVTSSKKSHDKDLAKKLWALSEEMTGLATDK